MGKGSSSQQQPTQTTVNQTSLPPYAEPYYRDLLARTGFETAQPYQTYQGQRLAYFSPMEQEALSRYGQLGVSGTPEELNQAGLMAFQAGQAWDPGIGVGARSTYMPGAPPRSSFRPDARQSQYQAGMLGPSGYYAAGQRDVGFEPGSVIDPGTLEAYSNPYTQQVTDIVKREAMRDADIRHQQLGLDAAKHGSLGGYRDAILRGETERNLTQELSDIQREGQERAFTSAGQLFEQDRQARAQREQFGQQQFQMNEYMKQRVAELVQSGFSLNEAARQAQEEFEQSQFGLNQQSAQFGAGLELQAYMAGEQARQEAARLGLSADQINQAGQIAAAQVRLGQQGNMLNAAQQLGGFAGQRQSMEMERLGAMLGAGQAERGLMQQGLDIGYQDYLRQQSYPLEMLAFYSQMLQGTPVQPGYTQTIYGQQPSTGQQLLGTGLAGLGLYNAFNRGG